MFKSEFFNMGQIVVTKSINNYMVADIVFTREIADTLKRYANKDWGNLDSEDKKFNDNALNYPEDLYLLGAYNTSKGKVWIITNRLSETPGDNATTVCFPDER